LVPYNFVSLGKSKKGVTQTNLPAEPPKRGEKDQRMEREKGIKKRQKRKISSQEGGF